MLCIQYVSYLCSIVFYVASTECYEYVKVATADNGWDVLLVAHLFLDAWAQTIVYKLAGYARDRIFSGGVDIYDSNVVEQRKGIGKLLVEITGAAVEVRLEDGFHTPTFVKLLYAEYALTNLCRVVSVIAQIDHVRGAHVEVEPAVNATERCHALSYFFFCSPSQLGQCHGGYSVLDVHRNRHTEIDASDVA